MEYLVPAWWIPVSVIVSLLTGGVTALIRMHEPKACCFKFISVVFFAAAAACLAGVLMGWVVRGGWF